MIVFVVRKKVNSDAFIRFGYSNYRDLCGYLHGELPESVNIIREGGHKPRLDVDGVYFNLSHSDDLVVLAVSNTEIGVDVERIRPVHREKFAFIEAEDDEEFFEKWTERESYVKFTGEGVLSIKNNIPDTAHFEHFDMWDYHACICA
ncbi:MAG: hypothetical protein J6V77_00775, partial [Clostridia bacterium]|nr:hypothetical protein [Clostridia bacterium]